MNFKANHKSIQHLSERLNNLISDSRAAESYSEKWLSFGHSESGIFFSAAAAAENAKQSLVSNYQRLAEVQRSAASEADKAAHSYEQMDRDEAARLDNSYKNSE